MGLLLLLALQLVVCFGGFVFVWRRLDSMSNEIAELRQTLSAANVQVRRKRAGGGAAAPLSVVT